MTVFSSKNINYLTANSGLLSISLFSLNAILFFAVNSQKTEWMGTIETPQNHWSIFNTQFLNTINSSATYYEPGGNSANELNAFFPLTFRNITDNTYLLYNDRANIDLSDNEENINIYRRRSYALDETCRLTFRGRTNMNLYQATMICLL
ncbi:hypothetical protein DZ860_19315 [Vibrio sinensis]|uniref:Uncharacterized protein n=1 Tax=Vibrio sinensis TaxID=2302434 RepID=A0A3A6QLF6_9VIBR|nr:hypothetical protein [Vibrio sinensis]RJX67167.1 hypothetical protein DZ860_19315 [Vibrio sinensis]